MDRLESFLLYHLIPGIQLHTIEENQEVVFFTASDQKIRIFRPGASYKAKNPNTDLNGVEFIINRSVHVYEKPDTPHAGSLYSVDRVLIPY